MCWGWFCRDPEEGERNARAAPDAAGESVFGYGGAGYGPIGSEGFQWASLEANEAPPPSPLKAKLIQLLGGEAGRERGGVDRGQLLEAPADNVLF